MKPHIQIYPDPKAMAEAVTEKLLRELGKARPPFSICLAGGSTPRLIYEHWAAAGKNRSEAWAKVHLFWGDERCVPPDDGESNFRMVRECLLDHIAIPPANVHRLRGEAPVVQEAVRYEEEIRAHVPADDRSFPRFDWILLGIGPDGHTASLFPGAQALQEKIKLCAAVEHPQTGQKRITLTLPCINWAKRITFLVAGRKKALIVKKLIQESERPPHIPAAMVLPEDGVLEVLLDAVAARETELSSLEE